MLGARRDRTAWAARMTEACMRGLPVALRVWAQARARAAERVGLA